MRCRHCWIAPKYQTEGNSYPALDLDLFKAIIEQAKPLGLTGVKLTGGEPLLHPQIKEILEHIRAENLDLTVETNGVLCTLRAGAQDGRMQKHFCLGEPGWC